MHFSTRISSVCVRTSTPFFLNTRRSTSNLSKLEETRFSDIVLKNLPSKQQSTILLQDKIKKDVNANIDTFFNGLNSEIFQTALHGKTINLEAIRNAKGDINEIRMILKGDEETCHSLFKIAVHEGDVISQIQLSHAFYGMMWGKDHNKDFSSLVKEDLEEFSYVPREFVLFNSVYDQALEAKFDWRNREIRGYETFRLAANRGSLSALLELMHYEWKCHTSGYGFAVQLRPFVDKGEKQLDYYFGHALKNGCQAGSNLYYEGLHWMNRSCGITVKYPRKHESFEEFKRRYVRFEEYGSSFNDHDGFRHVGSSVILAPSKEVWNNFVKEKLTDVKIAPLESYLFNHDQEQIKFLLEEYKIGAVKSSSFVESSIEGRVFVDYTGKSIQAFRIDSLSLYIDHKNIGEVSVQENTFIIHETIETIVHPNIQPVIDFVENVMRRTGSAHSAHSWLKHIGGSYI